MGPSSLIPHNPPVGWTNRGFFRPPWCDPQGPWQFCFCSLTSSLGSCLAQPNFSPHWTIQQHLEITLSLSPWIILTHNFNNIIFIQGKAENQAMRVHPGISLLNPTLEIVIPAQPCACDPGALCPLPQTAPQEPGGLCGSSQGVWWHAWQTCLTTRRFVLHKALKQMVTTTFKYQPGSCFVCTELKSWFTEFPGSCWNWGFGAGDGGGRVWGENPQGF